MESVDVAQANTHIKRLLFSVAELADMINEIGKDIANYKVAEHIFRLHRPMRQFQSQLHMLSGNFNHFFVQVEDPAYPTFDGWRESDFGDLTTAVVKLEQLFMTVNEAVKAVSCADHVHSMAIRASWSVLNDFYEGLKGNPRPDYL